MPADYLSRNLIAAISWDALDLQQAQNADPLLKALKNFLNCRMTPNANLSLNFLQMTVLLRMTSFGAA
jgi:hypothetical protein